MPKIKTNCVICGKEIYRWPYQLRDYHPCCSRTCWAKNNLGRKPPNKANLLNQKYGMLTVLEDVGSRRGHTLWKCRCDCGNETFVTTGLLRFGSVISCGCLARRRGANHPNWRQGFHITGDGYREIPKPGSTENHRYVSEHRAVMEKVLGRKLNSWEIVHHINQNKLDNRQENLQIMTREEHAALHACSRENTSQYQ